jgi:hypothetical protein
MTSEMILDRLSDVIHPSFTATIRTPFRERAYLTGYREKSEIMQAAIEMIADDTIVERSKFQICCSKNEIN